MAFLRATRGGETGRVYPLKPGVNVLGRDPRRCDVVLQHHAVSREHVRIDLLADGAYIEDPGSRNGVTVNGIPLQQGPAGRRRLLPRDRLEIATFVFVFQEDGAEQDEGSLRETISGSAILSAIDVSAESSRDFLQSTLAQGLSGLAAEQVSPGERDSPVTRSGPLRQLAAMLTILNETSGQLDLQTAPARLLDSLQRVFPQTEGGGIWLLDSQGSFFVVAARSADGSATPPRISRSVLDFVARRKQAVLSGEGGPDSVYEVGGSGWQDRLRSAMCAPLLDSTDHVLGLIELETAQQAERYTREDLQILAAIARHLAMVLENAGLHASALQAQRAAFEARFRRLIEGSIHGVLIHRDFEPLFVNQAWARLHGLTVEEVLDLDSVLFLVAAEDRPRLEQEARDLVAGRIAECRGERPAQAKSGEPIWIEEHTTVIEWEEGPALHTTIVDLTDRKRTELALRDAGQELERRVRERTLELANANQQLQTEMSERVRHQEELREAVNLYHSLVDNIPLCVVRKTVEGRVSFVNRALCKLIGKTPDELIGRTDHELFSAEFADEFRRADVQVMRSGKQLDLLETLPLAAGDIRQIHTLKTPIYDGDGKLLGTQLIFWDVTEQMRTEQERNRYAAELERSNRDLEQFAYSVSHDLQSPLRTITSYCQLIQRQYGSALSGEGAEYLTSAIEGTRRMRRLLDDLLAYSRVSVGPREKLPVDLERILTEALRNLAAAIRESHAVVTHDPLPTVPGDRTQLMQLLQNLINNAITHRRDVPPRVHLSAEEEDGEWHFQVQDNGEGIAPEDYDRVFLLLHRLSSADDRPGTGIGLSVCQRIVERHGGRIYVTSTKGQGSTFHFTLPKLPAGQG